MEKCPLRCFGIMTLVYLYIRHASVKYRLPAGVNVYYQYQALCRRWSIVKYPVNVETQRYHHELTERLETRSVSHAVFAAAALVADCQERGRHSRRRSFQLVQSISNCSKEVGHDIAVVVSWPSILATPSSSLHIELRDH